MRGLLILIKKIIHYGLLFLGISVAAIVFMAVFVGDSESNLENQQNIAAKLESDLEKMPSINLVGSQIDPDNKLKVNKGHLLVKKNPNGKGHLVYLYWDGMDPSFPQRKRPAVWFVIEDNVFTLNGPSKLITPSIPWERDMSAELFDKLDYVPVSASEAVELLY